ncbi:MAG: hypothetical protein JZU50_08410 [Desulfobulbaceae bacterium]|nr:hypothetical protein [Desulfobulbaceae bacterium]
MAAAPLYIGTCGFSSPEWVEAGIYPAGTWPAEMLFNNHVGGQAVRNARTMTESLA